jgi:MOSC domain-containing protein YiiM
VSLGPAHASSNAGAARIRLLAGPGLQGDAQAGVMAVVLAGGDAHPGDRVTVELPPPPLQRLEPV